MTGPFHSNVEQDFFTMSFQPLICLPYSSTGERIHQRHRPERQVPEDSVLQLSAGDQDQRQTSWTLCGDQRHSGCWQWTVEHSPGEGVIPEGYLHGGNSLHRYPGQGYDRLLCEQIQECIGEREVSRYLGNLVGEKGEGSQTPVNACSSYERNSSVRIETSVSKRYLSEIWGSNIWLGVQAYQTTSDDQSDVIILISKEISLFDPY